MSDDTLFKFLKLLGVYEEDKGKKKVRKMIEEVERDERNTEAPTTKSKGKVTIVNKDREGKKGGERK